MLSLAVMVRLPLLVILCVNFLWKSGNPDVKKHLKTQQVKVVILLIQLLLLLQDMGHTYGHFMMFKANQFMLMMVDGDALKKVLRIIINLRWVLIRRWNTN